MIEQQLKYYLSSPRFNLYLSNTNNDYEKACQLYKVNIELSEAFYPILSILEVCLRNAVNETLKTHFNDSFWFENNLPPEFKSTVSKRFKKYYRKRKLSLPTELSLN